jgi:beta-lactamase class A
MINPIPNLDKFQADKIAVAFFDLETQSEYYLHADEAIHAASTFKVAVLLEVYHQAHLGKFSLDERLTISNSFTSLTDGSRFSVDEKDDDEFTLYQKIGQTESIRELTRLMIVRSSNFATNILMEKVTAERVNAFLQELGIQGVSILRGVEDNKAFKLGLNNSASARGLMLIMKALAEGKVVTEKASKEMIEVLLAQEFNEGIPGGLPQNIKVAHKTGSIKGIYHDFGIVFPNQRKPYILAVMTHGFKKEEAAIACTASISGSIYEKLT